MRSIPTVAVVTLGALLFLGTAGCDREGPAEKVGERIDTATEAVREKAEDVATEIQGDGPAEQAGEAVDEAVEAAKEEAEDLTNQ